MNVSRSCWCNFYVLLVLIFGLLTCFKLFSGLWSRVSVLGAQAPCTLVLMVT